MKGNLTVIGLVPDGFTIEDIRINVPYRVAVQIPGHLAQRSNHLAEALQLQRVMQLGNVPAVREPPLAPILRGRGIAPHAPPVVQKAEAPSLGSRERESLLRELADSQAQVQHLRGLNETLQVTLTNMTEQLTQIQRTLDGLRLAPAEGTPARTVSQAKAETPSFLTEAVPTFIPATTEEAAAEVRISIPEKESSSAHLDEARGALRSLRRKEP